MNAGPDQSDLRGRYAELVEQLRASGWSEAKIIAALRRKAERDARVAFGEEHQ